MITGILTSLINAYSIVILIYVLMSWIPNAESGVIGQVYRALGALCDPYLNLFRRFIPPIGGMVDVSPIAALIVLQLLERLIAFIL